MNNQNKKQLCANRLRKISEDIFGTKSIGRFLSTVPHINEEEILTPKSVGELIVEANQQAEKEDWPSRWKEKYKQFASKLSVYQHELPHSAR